MAGNHTAWEPDFANSIRVLSEGLDHFEGQFHWTPESLAELRDRLIGNFPKWLDRLRNLMNASEVRFENLPQGLQDRYLAKDGRARVEVFPIFNGNDNEKLREFAKSVQQVEPRAIGAPVGIVEGGQAIVDSCIKAAWIAILASMVLLFIVLRRLGDVLLVLLPLLLTMVLMVAASIVLYVPLNLANVVAFPLVLGLGIAFGIYLVFFEFFSSHLSDLDCLFFCSYVEHYMFKS